MDHWEIALLLLGLTLLYVWFSKRKSSLSTFRGPQGLPLLGNVHQLNLELPHLTFMAWQKQYGGIMRIKVLGKEFLVVNTFEAIYEVLVTKGSDFAGRPQSYRLGLVTLGHKDIITGNPGPKWNLLRKTAHKQLKMYDKGLQHLENINLDIIGDLVRTFKGHKGERFDPKRAIYNAAMNTIALFLVGKKYPVSSEEFQLFELGEKLLIKNVTRSGWGFELDIFPWLKYFGNSTYRKLKQCAEIEHKLYNILKKDVLESAGEDWDTKGVLHALMKLYLSQSNEDRMPGGGLDEDHVRATAFDLIFAGSSTTVSSFYAYMRLISHHPNVQRKLQKEVDEKIGDSRMVSLTDRTSMPYTKATILELLRFSSVLGMGIPHKTVRDTSIGGKNIPAGTEVLTNLYALHHEEGFWDQPFEFRPDRFLEEDGALMSPSSEQRRHLMPFGAGPRVCLGEVLAQNRLFLLIATVSQMFEVKACPGNILYDSRQYNGGAIQCQKNYEIYLENRNDKLFHGVHG